VRRWTSRALLRWGPLALAAAWIAAATLVVLHGVAEARPGGGQGFGAPSGGGSSSGDSVEADILFALIWLAVEEPEIGVPLLLIFIAFVAVRRSWSKIHEWRTSGTVQGRVQRAAPMSIQQMAHHTGGGRLALARIAEIDPGFSVVLFEDFVFTLYARAHEARGGGRLSALAPFFHPNAGQALAQRTPGVQQVAGIVVGAFHIENVSGLEPSSGWVRAVLRFESNYTDVMNGHPHATWVEERWTLVRSKTAKSRSPDRARTVDCPECGGSIEHQVDMKCRYCGTSLAPGMFDWMVESVELLARASTGPALTTHAEERGTDQPTRLSPGAQQRMAAIVGRDPSVTWDAFSRRVGLVFTTLQQAWSAREEARLRPFVSDALYHYLRYWLEAYRKAGLRNVTEGSRIQRIELADARTDAWLDAVVVRVWASGIDVTMSEDGRVVSGDPRRERAYSEYWTFIRSARRQGAPRDDAACPSCGAPLQVEMAGNCRACRAHVTGGEFDWVLSKIEQDEVYAG
jgi:ribosomal protein L37AE/L43A